MDFKLTINTRGIAAITFDKEESIINNIYETELAAAIARRWWLR